ncbi:MAG: hypothetical protein HC921_20730 [Synechococcaceae cyanobacterium SM2_3_1]|nr:hypothetical protein [Synechococcaceae cyanobacterium SM2_3_1]
MTESSNWVQLFADAEGSFLSQDDLDSLQSFTQTFDFRLSLYNRIAAQESTWISHVLSKMNFDPMGALSRPGCLLAEHLAVYLRSVALAYLFQELSLLQPVTGTVSEYVDLTLALNHLWRELTSSLSVAQATELKPFFHQFYSPLSDHTEEPEELADEPLILAEMFV